MCLRLRAHDDSRPPFRTWGGPRSCAERLLPRCPQGPLGPGTDTRPRPGGPASRSPEKSLLSLFTSQGEGKRMECAHCDPGCGKVCGGPWTEV